MNNFTDLIPLPTEKRYLEQGPIRQKMGRILLYVIQSYSAGDRKRDYAVYSSTHQIIYGAWRRLAEDSEFCEQLELSLPAPFVSPNPRLIPHPTLLLAHG